MLPVLWKAEARQDLAQITLFVAERSPRAAHDLNRRIQRAVASLPAHPRLHRKGRTPGTRELIIQPNYFAVYRIKRTYIEILSITHARRRYPP